MQSVPYISIVHGRLNQKSECNNYRAMNAANINRKNRVLSFNLLLLFTGMPLASVPVPVHAMAALSPKQWWTFKRGRGMLMYLLISIYLFGGIIDR